MDILLDTHAFIWFISGDKQLPESSTNAIKNLENRCYLSIASLWEIAIKHSLKKLHLNAPFSEIADILASNDIEILPISFMHLQKLVKLPMHHSDPFDRLIIAQAISDRLTIISRDEHFSKYKCKISW